MKVCLNLRVAYTSGMTELWTCISSTIDHNRAGSASLVLGTLRLTSYCRRYAYRAVGQVISQTSPHARVVRDREWSAAGSSFS
jgi:hypothetical protein